MKQKYLVLTAIVVTIVIDIALMVYCHQWCANMPRTAVLWTHGAVNAYASAYFLGIVMCGMCSLPALLFWEDYDFKQKRKENKV